MSEAPEKIFMQMVEFQKAHIWPILFIMLIITGFFLYLRRISNARNAKGMPRL